jgi:hypothetical protein
LHDSKNQAAKEESDNPEDNIGSSTLWKYLRLFGGWALMSAHEGWASGDDTDDDGNESTQTPVIEMEATWSA